MKNVYFILPLFFFFVSPCHAVDTTHVQMQQAYRYQESGKNRAAVKIFESILQIHPKHLMALQGAGLSAYRLGQYDTAVFYFQKALNTEPGNLQVLNNLAAAFSDSNRLNDALRILKKIQALHPDPGIQTQVNDISLRIEKQADDETRAIVVGLLSEAHQAFTKRAYDRALQKCNQILLMDSGHVRARKLREDIIRVSASYRVQKLYQDNIRHFQAEKIETSIQEIEKYMKKNAKDATVEGYLCDGYIRYGTYLNKNTHYTKAAMVLNKALRLKTPLQTDALLQDIQFQLGLSYMGLDRWDDAHQLFTKIYIKNPGYPGLHKKSTYTWIRSHIFLFSIILLSVVALIVAGFIKRDLFLSHVIRAAGLGKGDYYYGQMDWNKAAREYKNFIKGKELTAVSSAVWEKYGFCLLKIGMEDDAIEAYFHALENGETQPDSWKALLKTLEGRKNDAAIARLSGLVLRTPSLFNADEEFHLRTLSAKYYKETSDYSRGYNECQTLIQLKPGAFEPRWMASDFLLETGDYTGAVECLVEMLKMDPAWMPHIINMFQRIIDKNPGFLRAHHELAEIHRTNGRIDDAILEYQFILQNATERESFLNVLGDLLLQRSRFREALDAYYELCQIHPESIPIRSQLGDIYLRLGERESASLIAEQILDMDPYSIDAVHLARNIGVSYREESHLSESKSVLEAAIQKSQIDHAGLSFELGRTLIDEKKFHEAITVLQKVTKASTKLKYEALDLIAVCWMEMGDPKMAANVLSSLSLDKVTMDQRLLKSLEYHLARALEAIGETDKAVILYEKILRLDIDYRDVGAIVMRIKNTDTLELSPIPGRKKKKKGEETISCEKCNSLNPPGKKFCGECGAELGHACKKCGFQNGPLIKFCGSCGDAIF